MEQTKLQQLQQTKNSGTQAQGENSDFIIFAMGLNPDNGAIFLCIILFSICKDQVYKDISLRIGQNLRTL